MTAAMSMEPALVSAENFAISSELLGPLSVRAADVVTFASGLLGFPECRRFALLPGAAAMDGTYWLQSLEYPALAFLLIDPFVFFPDYSVDVAQGDAADLDRTGASGPADMALLAIVTLPASAAGRPTANLQGPIVLNLRTRRGKQLVCADTDQGVRCPFDLPVPAAS
jgi:flagellar assembly factor FliW